MTKSLCNFLVLLFAVIAVCAMTGLAACSESVKLESLSIEDARTVFLIGDEFEYGENFKVFANYSDGTKTDVTSEVEIRKESGFDMNVSGNYQLTVIYGNKREVYTVYVNDFDSPLRKIELDTANVKKDFELGDSINLDGLIIKTTYENAQGGLIESTSSSLRNLTVEIADENGNKLNRNDVFSSLGNYTVTVSSGSVKDSYTVSVQGINISTVQGALTVGNFFKSEVRSGTQKIREALVGNSVLNDSFDYEYEFGNNYTRIEEKIESAGVQHFSIDSEGIFCVTVKDENIVSNYEIQAGMMNGAPVHLWYYGLTEFGIEAVLNNLYTEAKKCSNNDLKETADEASREYSFTFSGLIFRSNDANYFENTVSFSLGEKYNIENVEFTQIFWENNTTAEGVAGWELNFRTDENGITKPLARFTHKLEVTVHQTTGERTAENPYSRNMFRIQDYNLVYGGKDLGDDGTVSVSLESGRTLEINIENILPVEANFAQDIMYLSLDGVQNSEVDSNVMLSVNGLTAWRRNNTITVNFSHGGQFTLVFRTTNTRKTITFDVTGYPPTSMSGRIYNDVAEFFSSGSSKLTALNGSIYFYGAVNEYANPAQTAAVTSDNAGNANIERVKINGIDCFKFSADSEGEYTVVVSSSASALQCVFTFTVSDIPDYGNLLKGSYSVIDREESIFNLDFTPAGEMNGTVVVTKTPTQLDGTPIQSETKTANYSYVADVDNLTIILTFVSGDELGVGLSVDAAGNLILIDQYNDRYTLAAVSVNDDI